MMKPQGTLIAIGGNEEKEFTKIDERFQTDFGEGGILQHIIKHAGGPKSRIEVITSASDIPGVVGEKYWETFMRLGAENVGILDIRDQEIAECSSTSKRIEDADAILFSGGDQSQISRFIKDTKAHELIYDRYMNEEFILAGTSAGAVVMAEEMIAGGRNGNILRKNDLKMGKGLGLMKQVIFDSHFIRRGRFGRLAEAVALYPDKLGIGLGEDTGVIIREGNICEIIGSGMVVLFDGSNFDYNQYRNLKDGMPISLANLAVHILATQDKYYIREKKAEIHYNPRHHKEEFTKSE
jgi:cyanophycinase